MRISIFLCLKGYFRVFVPKENMAKWANSLYRYAIPHQVKAAQTEEGLQYEILLSASNYHRVISCFPDLKEGVTLSPLSGIPSIKRFISGRIGLPIGLLFGLALFFFLSSFVWEIRVVDSQDFNEELILQKLSELGLSEGAFIPTLDTDSVASAYLAQSDQMSWMNIYRKGTVLYVSCRAYTSTQPPPSVSIPKAVNLVAKRDAVIEELILEGGRPMVSKGMVVKKGDLLVSGVYENSIGYFFAEAKGEVKGKVTESIEIFVPYENAVTVKEKSRLAGLTVCLFGKNLRLFSSALENAPDVIPDKRRVYLFDTVRLPISLTFYHRLIYSHQTVSLSETEAMRLAFERLRADVHLRLENSELVSQRVDGTFTNEGYLLKCELTYIENIAETIEFSVN